MNEYLPLLDGNRQQYQHTLHHWGNTCHEKDLHIFNIQSFFYNIKQFELIILEFHGRTQEEADKNRSNSILCIHNEMISLQDTIYALPPRPYMQIAQNCTQPSGL
jgi:hypothetical protein